MATFTRLDDADAHAIAAAAGLGAVRAVTPIAAGTVNSNFAFDCDGGRFFVRVNEGKTADDVAWEAALVDDLAAAGLPTPPPRRVAGQPFVLHRGLLVSVFPWVDGIWRGPDEVTAADAAAIGAALARIHAVGDARGRATWRAGIYRFEDIVARFDGFRASADPALAEAIAVLGPELAALAEAAPIRARATVGLIHGDLFRDNVLWAGPPADAPGALAAVLDFEQAAAGSLVYDVAVAVHDWCWDAAARAVRPALARALVAAHQAARPWTDADRAAFPVELRAAAARFTVTRITDVHLRHVDNPDKDFRAFLARLVHWRSPAAAHSWAHGPAS